MNGKDLIQALNDIDERYIEEALPWSAAVKKERHPVWALAAGLALCLGLGAGAALLFGGPLLTSGDPGPEVTTLENAATGEARAAEQEAPEVPIPDLEFAVNDTGIGRATGGVYAAGEGTQRELTLDELSSLREQPGLSWMGDYYLTGTALFDENGGTLQVMVAGYDPSIVDESLETFPVEKTPAFLLALGQEDLPTQIEEQLAFLEEPNNTVEGVGVRAAQFPYQDSYIDPVSGESTQVDSTLYCTGCTLDGASVGLMAIADGTALTEEEAQRLAEVAAGYGVHYGLSLEGLSAEPKGKDTPNVNYGDSYHLTVLGPLGSRAPLDFAAYTVETQEEYGSYEEFLQAMEEDFNLGRWPEGFAEGSTNRELTQEEMQSIWGGQLPWQENLPLAGWAVFDPSGDLEGVYLYGADENSQEIGSRFLVVLRPGPLDWEALRRRELSYDIIQKPNNQVNGQDVYAVTTALDQFYEDDAGERADLGDHITYQASFQKGEDPMTVTVYGYAQGAPGDDPTPEEQQAEALARDEAQALVETVVGRSLYGPLSLEGIAGRADSAPQEESSASSQSESAVPSEIEENESSEGGLNYLDVSFNTSEYIPYMEEQTQLYQHYAEAEQRGETWSVSRGLEEDELNFLLDQDFLPNQEDFAILEGGATLDWMEEPLWVELSGFPTQETRSSGISAFTLYLSKGDVPVSEAKYLSTLFPEPNNTLEGVDIYAFRWEEAVSYHVFTDYTTDYPYPHPTPFHDSDQSVEFGLAFQKEDIGVAMTVRCDKWGFASEEEAKDFALSLAENIITQEVIPMENDMQVLSLPEN